MAKTDKPDAQPEELKDLDRPAPKKGDKLDPDAQSDLPGEEVSAPETTEIPETPEDPDALASADEQAAEAKQDPDAVDATPEAEIAEATAAEGDPGTVAEEDSAEATDRDANPAGKDKAFWAEDGRDPAEPEPSDIDPSGAETAEPPQEIIAEAESLDGRGEETADGTFFAETEARDDTGDADRKPDTPDKEAPAPAEAASAIAAAPAAQERRGGFFPLLLGGVIAAVIGFFAGQSEVVEPYLPASFKGETVDLGPLEARIDEQAAALNAAQTAISAEVSEVAAALDALTTAQAEAPAVAVDDTAAMAAVAEVTAALEALTARIEALEARPEAPAPLEDVATTDDVDGLQAALSEQNEALAAQKAELEALAERARLAEENATLEAQKVLARAALTRVTTAVDNGGSFEPALSALEEVTPVTIPDELRAAATDGLTTLAELQAGFPPAARAALGAARAEIPESEVEGIGGFIKRQLSVRSVVPREGDDPDAILSRAEAAVRSGDLIAALGELAALPEVASTAMQEWLDQAAARQSALDAVADLTNSLSTN